MNDDKSSNGDSAMEPVEVSPESPAARRKRMNMLRMRRNRRDPSYRADEQRRQRERRRQRLAAARIGKHASTAPATAPQSAQSTSREPPLRVRPVLETQTRNTPTPHETAVVQIPTMDGMPVLPSVVTFSVFAPVPSNLTIVVVPGDSVRPLRTAYTVSPSVGHPPCCEIHKAVQMGRNLNLDSLGTHWYSHEAQHHQPLTSISRQQEPTVKREI